VAGLSRPPVIGVGAAREPARWAVWELPAALVASNYLEAIERARGIPLLIPPSTLVAEHADVVLDRIDGLLLVGGPDLDPGSYGAEASALLEETAPARDAPEIALVRRAVALGLPTLGICRGMQVVNVALGGTLVQHLPERLGHDGHRVNMGSFDGNWHGVRTEAGSRVERAVGDADVRVPSHHHQAVEDVGRGLRVTAWSEEGVPEGLERTDGDGYLVGVQWHPEADPESRVIASLVEAARP